MMKPLDAEFIGHSMNILSEMGGGDVCKLEVESVNS
jgi:hypothetical protein